MPSLFGQRTLDVAVVVTVLGTCVEGASDVAMVVAAVAVTVAGTVVVDTSTVAVVVCVVGSLVVGARVVGAWPTIRAPAEWPNFTGVSKMTEPNPKSFIVLASCAAVPGSTSTV